MIKPNSGGWVEVHQVDVGEGGKKREGMLLSSQGQELWVLVLCAWYPPDAQKELVK